MYNCQIDAKFWSEMQVGDWCIRPPRRELVDLNALLLAREFKGYFVFFTYILPILDIYVCVLEMITYMSCVHELYQF